MCFEHESCGRSARVNRSEMYTTTYYDVDRVAISGELNFRYYLRGENITGALLLSNTVLY